MKWYLKVLKQYADFNGRARRKEYWMFLLFNMLFAGIAMTLDIVTGLADSGMGILYPLYALGTLVPGVAVCVRRLHDIGKNWTWIFIGLVPVIGGVWLLILMIKDSDPIDNEFGPYPQAATT